MTVPPTEPTRGEDAGYATPRFVGDAAPVASMPLSRVFDVACYVITGIAMLVAATQVSDSGVWFGLAGAAVIAYGVKVAITRTSYWRHSAMYLVPVFGVVWLFSAH